MKNIENGILEQKEIVASPLTQFTALFECPVSVTYLLLAEIEKMLVKWKILKWESLNFAHFPIELSFSNNFSLCSRGIFVI